MPRKTTAVVAVKLHETNCEVLQAYLSRYPFRDLNLPLCAPYTVWYAACAFKLSTVHHILPF
jgi:hypothetical protein